MWTCIECGNSYNKLTGDPEERMCEDCLYPEEEELSDATVGEVFHDMDKIIKNFDGAIERAKLKVRAKQDGLSASDDSFDIGDTFIRFDDMSPREQWIRIFQMLNENGYSVIKVE